MKECPTCCRCEEDAVEICPSDGASLQATLEGPAVLDGKYRVEKRLGRGGMGIVYRVRHIGLRKTFALKVIATFDRALLARFRTEAEALGKLKHPNIVDVTDFGIDRRRGGLPYLVMEYLEGSTLADRIRVHGRLSLHQGLPVFESIAAAIDYAHDCGILHLDLKPGNIFVSNGNSNDQTIKILDFGLARFITDQLAIGAIPAAVSDHAPDVADTSRCPRCGTQRQASAVAQTSCPACLLQLGLLRESTPAVDNPLLDSAGLGEGTRFATSGPLTAMRGFGTIPYMAPEVLGGHMDTQAADIYSFAILIYEVLVGRPPFEGSAAEIIAGHCQGVVPPPSMVNSALPRDLDAPLLAALARLPAHRPRQAIDLVRQVEAVALRARVGAWRAKEVPRRIAVAAVAAVVLPLVLSPVWRVGIVQQIENRTVDARFRVAPSRATDGRLVLVSLDEASLTADPTPLSDKADDFGRALQLVFAAGAQGVAIDLLLPEAWARSRSFSELILNHADTLTLAAFSSPAGVVIGPECLNPLTAAALGPTRASNLFAFVNLDEDPDGVIRRARLSYLDQGGMERDSWARHAAKSLGAVPAPATGTRFVIDYSADSRRLKRVSWKDLMQTLELEPETFAGRLVLVGGDFAGFGGDYHRVPFHADASQGVSGLMLQALIVNTILSGFPVSEGAPFTYLLVGTGLAIGAIMLSFLLSARWLPPMLFVGSLIPLYLGAIFLLFRQKQVLLPVAGPLLTMGVAILVVVVFRLRLPSFPKFEADAQ